MPTTDRRETSRLPSRPRPRPPRLPCCRATPPACLAVMFPRRSVCQRSLEDLAAEGFTGD